MSPIAILAIVAVLVIIALVVKNNKKEKYTDVTIPMPSTLRSDLLVGYYGSLARTWDQVKNDVNLFWFFNFYSRELFVQQIKESHPNMKFVIDLAGELSTLPKGAKKRIFNENAEEDLRAYFNFLRAHGVLHRIAYLYPVDEPALGIQNKEEHLKMLQAAKKVAAEFDELRDARWLVIYLRGSEFWNIEHHDVVGVDDYDQKSQVLTIGEHARLLKAKLPHQKTAIIPGCGYGQNPDPFVAYAHANPDEVEMVVPFLFFEYEDKSLKDEDFVGLEAAEPALRERWIDAAWKIRNLPRETQVSSEPLQSWLDAKAAWEKAQEELKKRIEEEKAKATQA